MPCNAASALALALSAAVAASAARSAGHGRHGGFLSLRNDLQPQSVALTLARVEQDWREQATAFARCKLTAAANGSAGCQASSGRFEASCATVVSAVVQASSGKRQVVQEYLDEVCVQKGLEGWRAQACSNLSSALLAAMSPNAYSNREGVDAAVPCQRFWQGFLTDEVARVEKEQAEETAEEQRRAEAAEKVQQAAQEAAAAEAQAKQESATEAEALRAAEAERGATEAAVNATQQRILNATQEVSARAQDEEQLASRSLAEAQAALDAAAARPRPTPSGPTEVAAARPWGSAKKSSAAPDAAAVRREAIASNATNATVVSHAAEGPNASQTA